MKLYEIIPAYESAMDLENFAEREKQLDLLAEEATKKVGNICKLTQNMGAETSAIETEITRLMAMKKRIENNREWLMEYLQRFMESQGANKIETDLFRISIINNPPSVKILDESKIPSKYIQIKEIKSIDKILIKEDLKSGAVPFIEGVELEQTTRLNIK